jgi:hypothetical protein
MDTWIAMQLLLKMKCRLSNAGAGAAGQQKETAVAGDPLDQPVKCVSVFVPITWLLASSSIFVSQSAGRAGFGNAVLEYVC